MGQAVHTIEFAPGSAALANPDRISAYNVNGAAFSASATSITALGAITAGTGLRMLPNLAFTGGTGSGGLLVATALKAVGTPTVGAAGTGYNVADTITLANGVVVTVATLTGGAGTGVATLTLTTPGVMSNYAAPANPMPQVSSSGAGTGASINVLWGLLSAQIINSGNYSVVPTVAVTFPDGNGSGVSIAANTLGGNGAAILVGQTGLVLPASYGIDATASVPAFVSCPLKRADCFAIALTPITAATTLAAGTVDINLAG